MNLAKNAAYLYVHSKELLELNKKLKKLSKKAEKHLAKTHSSKEGESDRYKIKHRKVKEKLEILAKKHNKLLTKLNQHYRYFYHALKKEHKT